MKIEKRITYHLELSKEEAIFLLVLTAANSPSELTRLLNRNTVQVTAEDIEQTRIWAQGRRAGATAMYFDLHNLLTKGETK